MVDCEKLGVIEIRSQESPTNPQKATLPEDNAEYVWSCFLLKPPALTEAMQVRLMLAEKSQ